MIKIQVILGSIRQGRSGMKVLKWVESFLKTREDLAIEVLDLKDYPLVDYNEALPPVALNGDYTSEIAKKWVKKIGGADGYIIVTPEYNHGYTAALKNALDYPYSEWNRKPVAFVSYSSGPVGGARAVEQLRQVAIQLQMTPIQEAVHIASVDSVFDEGSELREERYRRSLDRLVEDLVWWTETLRAGRQSMG